MYGIIFGTFDILMGIYFSKSQYEQVRFDLNGEKKTESKSDKEIKFLRDHPKLTLILIIVAIPTSVYFAYESYKISTDEFIFEPVPITAYEIRLNISESPGNATILKSDEHFTLNKENFIVAIPLVRVDGVLYPMTKRLSEKKELIKYEETNLYLIEDISPKLINMTYIKKKRNFSMEKIYYCTSMADAYFFLELAQNGYGKVTSFCSFEILRLSEVNPSWYPSAHKVYFSENSESNIGAYAISTGESDFASIFIITLNSEVAQKVKDLTKANEDVNSYVTHDDIDQERLFSHRELI